MMSDDNRQRREWARELLAIGLLIGVVLLFMAPALMPGRVFMPLDIVTQGWPPWQQPNQPVEVHNWLLTDVVNYIYPVKQFMAESVRAGELPLWNPYVLTGYPFAYNTQAGLFYPLSILYYLFPWYTAVDGTIILQALLGALFMYAFLRRWAMRRPAAVVGGVLFACNGLMMVWLEWQVVHAAIVWLPLQLLLLESMIRAAERQDGRWARALLFAMLLALAFAIPWLGGHWNWTLYTSMTLAAYGLWRSLPLFRTREDWRGCAAVLGLLLLPFVVGGALALVQVWPAFTFLSRSHRFPLPFRDSLLSGLWDRAVVMLTPNFFGNPSHGNNWWGIDNYNEATFYLGILPLFLIGLALFLRRDRLTLFFAGWGALGLLWTLGTPAYGILYVLPVFSGLYPGRAAIIVVVCGSVLAAAAFDRLLAADVPDKRRLTRVTLIIAAILVAVLLGYLLAYRSDVISTSTYLFPYLGVTTVLLLISPALLLGRVKGRLAPGVFGALVLALVAADLYFMSYGYNTVSATGDFYPASPIVDFLRADPEPFRIATPAQGIVFYPNTSLMARIGNVSGYEPGLPLRHVEFYNAAEGESAIRFNRILMPLKALDSPLLDVLNVKYITTVNDWWLPAAAVDVTQEQVDDWLPVTSGAGLVQTFQVADAGLHRVDLFLRTAGEAAGPITVRVLTGNGGQELAHAVLPADQVTAGEAWQSFYFEAFPSEWGRDFRLIVEHAGAGEVQVGRANSDAYAGGALLVEDISAESDLAFRSFYLPRPQLAYEDGKTRIYVNPGYQPRAFVVHRALVVEAHEALDLVLEHAEELAELVVLEAGPSGPPPMIEPAETQEVPAESSVVITGSGLNEVRLEVDMAAPGYVVLADSYYPGWRATVDGDESPIYQADYLLRAVHVPGGVHEVVFSFRPPDFIWGAVISLSALLLTLTGIALLALHVRRGL